MDRIVRRPAHLPAAGAALLPLGGESMDRASAGCWGHRPNWALVYVAVAVVNWNARFLLRSSGATGMPSTRSLCSSASS